MPIRITEFETTPNPNALKCWLDQPVSDGVKSFLNADMAAEHPLAARLFADAGLTTLLLNGDWMTINKPPAAKWPTVKKRVQAVLDELT